MRDRDEYSDGVSMPDVYERPLTRRELRQKEKLEKQAEGIRRKQEALEEKRREAARKEAERQAKIQARLDEKEAKKRAKQEEKEARERARLEAQQAKERAKQEKKDAKPAGKGKGAGPGASGHKAEGKKAPRAKSAKEKRISAQNSIPYKEMGRDGICRVRDGLYSKSIRFYDINYQLAQNEDKSAIFENWCEFLNYFDSTIRFQLSFINHKSSMKEYENVIRIEPQGDAFDDVRMEYAQMLQDQLSKGNNGLLRTKYITFSIEAGSIAEARPKLERIEADILNNFKVLGVQAYPLSGVERLQILYETFNPDQEAPFTFQYDQLLKTGLSTKDFIAPTSFVFKNGRTFQMGGTLGAASYLQILAPRQTSPT